MDPDFYDNITEAVTRGMMGGFFSPVEHSPVHCGSNNCTFEPFTTLAACMKIKDISHTLEVSVIENSVSEDWSGVEYGHLAIHQLVRILRQLTSRSSVTKNGNFFGEPTTAWRARIPQIDMELVTPVSIAFSMEGRNRSIAFQDANDNLTAIANLYLIWCNAGNVSVSPPLTTRPFSLSHFPTHPPSTLLTPAHRSPGSSTPSKYFTTSASTRTKSLSPKASPPPPSSHLPTPRLIFPPINPCTAISPTKRGATVVIAYQILTIAPANCISKILITHTPARRTRIIASNGPWDSRSSRRYST